MEKSSQQLIEEYARKHAIDEKEMIRLLCEYIDTLEKSKITYDSALETFLESVLGYK
jgi:hypothetical protein